MLRGAQRRDRVKIKDTFILKGNCTFTERLVSFDKPEISLGKITVGGVKVLFDKSLGRASYSEDYHRTVSKSEPEVMTVYCINIECLYPEKGEFEFIIKA